MVYDSARRRDDAEFELVDLADFNLPLLDDPIHRLRRDFGNSRHREFATGVGRTASRYSPRRLWFSPFTDFETITVFKPTEMQEANVNGMLDQVIAWSGA